MYYQIQYAFSRPDPELMKIKNNPARFEFMINEISNHLGYIAIGNISELEITLLAVLPNYPQHMSMLNDQILRFIVYFHFSEDFESKRLKFKRLHQHSFFTKLTIAAEKFEQFDLMYKIYNQFYFINDTSTRFEKYYPITEQSNLINILKSEELKNMREIEKEINVNPSRFECIVFHEPNDTKASYWISYLAMKTSRIRSFRPSTLINTNLNPYTSLKDISNLKNKGFMNSLIGNIWLINISEEMMLESTYIDLIKNYLIPIIEENMGLGKIIIHMASNKSIASYFNREIYELWSLSLKTEIEGEHYV